METFVKKIHSHKTQASCMKYLLLQVVRVVLYLELLHLLLQAVQVALFLVVLRRLLRVQ